MLYKGDLIIVNGQNIEKIGFGNSIAFFEDWHRIFHGVVVLVCSEACTVCSVPLCVSQ